MITYKIDNPLHLKAIDVERREANKAARQAVRAFNAALPAWYEGEGGKPVPHPDTQPDPTPLTMDAFALAALTAWLDGKVKDNNLDVADLDAQIAALEEAKVAALAVVAP